MFGVTIWVVVAYGEWRGVGSIMTHILCGWLVGCATVCVEGVGVTLNPKLICVGTHLDFSKN